MTSLTKLNSQKSLREERRSSVGLDSEIYRMCGFYELSPKHRPDESCRIYKFGIGWSQEQLSVETPDVMEYHVRGGGSLRCFSSIAGPASRPSGGPATGTFTLAAKGSKPRSSWRSTWAARSPTANPIIATAPFGMDFGAGNIANTHDREPERRHERRRLGRCQRRRIRRLRHRRARHQLPARTATSSVIFGSNTVGSTTITNWIGTRNTATRSFTYTTNDRVGDLGQLRRHAPRLTRSPAPALTFPFAGVTFIASINTLAGMTSVAGVNIGGRQGLLIGAPGALDANGANAGTGRVYLVSGNFNVCDRPDDRPRQPGRSLRRSTSSRSRAPPPAGSSATSVAGGVNIFGDGSADVIMGAPAATVGGHRSTPVPSTSFRQQSLNTTAQNQTINVTTLGQSGSHSVIFAGVNSGDRAGFSVADAGNVNGHAGGTVSTTS